MSKAHDDKVSTILGFVRAMVEMEHSIGLGNIEDDTKRLMATGLIAQLQRIDSENPPPKPGPVMRGGTLPESVRHPSAPPGYPEDYQTGNQTDTWNRPEKRKGAERDDRGIRPKGHYGIGDVD